MRALLNAGRPLSGLDGIVIDGVGSNGKTEAWPDRFAGHAEEIALVSFADALPQRRWLLLTLPDD